MDRKAHGSFQSALHVDEQPIMLLLITMMNISYTYELEIGTIEKTCMFGFLLLIGHLYSSGMWFGVTSRTDHEKTYV